VLVNGGLGSASDDKRDCTAAMPAPEGVVVAAAVVDGLGLASADADKGDITLMDTPPTAWDAAWKGEA